MFSRFANSIVVITLLGPGLQAQQLTLNPHLDYNSDSVDGPLITGNNPAIGVVPGKPNYVMIYGEGCYNSKHQAQRTVHLAALYGARVNFVLVDLDKPQTPAQQQLVQQYYRGSIPDLILVDPAGKPIYNQAGEQSEKTLSDLLNAALSSRSATKMSR